MTRDPDDYCGTHGTCSICERRLCVECGGDNEPFDCLDADERHCNECMGVCDRCQAVLADYVDGWPDNVIEINRRRA